MTLRTRTRVVIVLACACASLAVPRDLAVTRFGFPLQDYDRVPVRYSSLRGKQIGLAALLEERWQAGEVTQFEKLSSTADDRWLRLAPGIIGAFSSRAAAINFVAWIAVSALCIKLWGLLRRRASGGGNCAQCGYDLTGNVSGRCPECGLAR